MTEPMTRRGFLKMTGGITLLGLIPHGQGLFAAPAPGAVLPLFTAIPYLQPGAAGALAEDADTLVVAWQTEERPAAFRVQYGPTKAYGHTAAVTRSGRTVGRQDAPTAPVSPGGALAVGDIHRRFDYSAALTGLPLDKPCFYRVEGNGRLIAEGFAAGRRRRGADLRIAIFGDNSCGGGSDHTIAYHVYKASPDFVMNVGDNVYDRGLASEYTDRFLAVYNADTADPALGAPLLRSVRYYTVLGNHDIHNAKAANFDAARDSLGYYTAMHLPMNGPAKPTYPTLYTGADSTVAEFRAAAGRRYPQMANYSFDAGDVHFLCLDSNLYVDPSGAALQQWMEADLAATDALWKLVVMHHPPFNVGHAHYAEQQMRVLAPLLEKHGVDAVFSGHTHTYQRTRPLKFVPTDTAKVHNLNHDDRYIPGTFTVDTAFDGITKTHPNGIIYIVTGAGGQELHDPDLTDAPDKWLHAQDSNVAYGAKFYSRLHSFTVADVRGRTLTLTQWDEHGTQIDALTLTKD